MAAATTVLSSGSLMLLIHLSPSHSINMIELNRSTQSLHLPYMIGEGTSFPGSVPLSDMIDCESVVGIIPDDSGIAIGYLVDEFTYIWSAEHFIALSHIYTCFMGKASTFTNFQLNQGVRIIPFLEQAAEDIQHGHDSIFTASLDTPELHASFDEVDALPSSVLNF